MKALYFDLIAGASGDMILGGLIDAGVSIDELRSGLEGLHIDEFELEVHQVIKNGFQAKKVEVKVGNQPPERHLKEILELIQSSDLPDNIRDRSSAIFQRIAEVEAGIHNTPLDQVHLHELGGTDTIIDVVGALLALELLNISRIFASSVPLGSGFIQGAHGEIPLPAPATLGLLKGVPVRGLDIQAELITPTGAALLTTLVEGYGPLPEMILEGVGYGAGSRDLPLPNLVRVLVGSLQPEVYLPAEQLTVLECNLDDLNPEVYPYMMEQLFQGGALDVNLVPVHMKKNRPGIQVQVLSQPGKAADMRRIMFRETSTIGIKQHSVSRFPLPRKTVTVKIPAGEIRIKTARTPEGELKVSPEYEDCQRLARDKGIPLQEVYRQAVATYLTEFG